MPAITVTLTSVILVPLSVIPAKAGICPEERHE